MTFLKLPLMTVIKVEGEENRPQWAVSSSVVMRLELKITVNKMTLGQEYTMAMENPLIALFRLINHS